MSALCASQKVQHSPEYYALTSYLSGKTRDPAAALDAFAEAVEDDYKKTGDLSVVQGLLWRAWEAVVTVAVSTSYISSQRQQLADFLVRLGYRPTLARDEKICQIDGMTIWRDLPVLGWELRESWNFAASVQSGNGEQESWINLNACTATLVASIHSSAMDIPDYSLFFIWTVRTALEDQEHPPDIAVEAASVWLIYAAVAIWNFCETDKSFDGETAGPGTLFKDQTWTGFSVDRWQAWVQRLDDLQDSTVDESTVAFVHDAIAAMDSVIA